MTFAANIIWCLPFFDVMLRKEIEDLLTNDKKDLWKAKRTFSFKKDMI
ncbi:hypothetical protein [Enterococcus sp. DIV0876]